MATGPFTLYQNAAGTTFGNFKWWYRSRRDADGSLVLETNPFLYARTVLSSSMAGYPPLGTDGLAYYYTNPSNAVSTRMPDVYAKAYDRFAEKIWGDSQLLLAVDFAERSETLRMLGDALKRVAKAVVYVKRRRFKSAMKALRATPPGKDFSPSKEFFANWMALRYGWIPTLGSIHSLCEALAKPIAGKSGVRIAASAKGSYHHVEMDRFPPYGKRWTNDWDAKCRISGRVVVSDPRLAGLNQYGLVNPFVTIWELVSKSFVVGWFLPIGSLLADLTRFVGLSFTEATVSYSVTGVDVWHYATPIVTQKTVLKQRSVFSSAPPMPTRLALGNGLNPKRCMDALALITGALRSR
jgi:hypothetical protein